MVFSNYWAIVFLIFDFAARAFTTGKYSLLKYAALKISNALSLLPKMKDLAPKKFAATMGFGFCLLITATVLLDYYTAALILTAIMTVFALLESLFAVCVGCYVYSLTKLLEKNKVNINTPQIN